jgi:hypothetical protein
MASRSNAFGGDFQRYSHYLASWGFQQLAVSQSRIKPFVTDFEGVPCVIVPSVSNHLVKVTVFFAPTRALSAARLVSTPVADLAANWRLYCRAFVSARIDPRSVPHLIPEDFNSTRNARSEILTAGPQWCPEFELLDEMLGTDLAACSPDPLEDGPTLVAKMFGWKVNHPALSGEAGSTS